jgi:hypothetical protein
VSPIDALGRKELMYQNTGWNVNGNAQTKKLQGLGFSFNQNFKYNDFYEPRYYGRVFRNKGSLGVNLWFESNSAKKYSWTGSIYMGTGGVFHRTSFEYVLTGKVRFSSKFSVDYSMDVSTAKNQPGWAAYDAATKLTYFSRRDVKSVENILNFKYNFTNRMGLTLRTRHYWSKVDPQQIYELNKYGDLQTPNSPFTGNVNQNYNFLSVDMVYNWQFAQGSFFSIVWKDIADNFEHNGNFEGKYTKNLGNTIDGHQFNSLSVRVIYFLDYLTFKNKIRAKTP